MSDQTTQRFGCVNYAGADTGKSIVERVRELGHLRVEPDAITTANLERAMRSLARAAATFEFDGDSALAGAFFYQSRAICSEIGRDWDSVVAGARQYAERVLCGIEAIA